MVSSTSHSHSLAPNGCGCVGGGDDDHRKHAPSLDDVPHVGQIDPHPKRDGGDRHLDQPAHPLALRVLANGIAEALRDIIRHREGNIVKVSRYYCTSPAPNVLTRQIWLFQCANLQEQNAHTRQSQKDEAQKFSRALVQDETNKTSYLPRDTQLLSLPLPAQAGATNKTT